MKKILGSVAVIGGFLAAAMPSFAAAPAVDATVSANTTDLLSGLNTAGLSGLGVAVTAGGVLIVTGALVFFAIRHFRAIAHV